jgi:threonine 3-dehydrogenase
MRALVKARPERGLWAANVATPDAGRRDVLVKISKTSVCGTDLNIYEWDDWSQRTIPVPMVTGHEWCGEIAALGDDVPASIGLAIGQRVTGEGHVTCGVCRNCRSGKQHQCRSSVGIGVTRPGAFAEYLTLPATNIHRLPMTVSDDVASIMDPLGNAVHCALSFDLVAEDVLITGAGSLSGLLQPNWCSARHEICALFCTDFGRIRCTLFFFLRTHRRDGSSGLQTGRCSACGCN